MILPITPHPPCQLISTPLSFREDQSLNRKDKTKHSTQHHKEQIELVICYCSCICDNLEGVT